MKYKLSEIMDIIGGGTPKTSNPEYWNGNIPWLSVKDFNNDYRYVYETEKAITQAGLDNSSTKMLKRNDSIISARGTVGEMAMIPFPMAFNQSCYGLRAKKGLVDAEYLYYLIKHNVVVLKKNTHGSVFDTITHDTFDDIEVELPSLKEQKVVASILRNLDDKIEVNNEINKNLEEQAQAIFKSWFVDFEPFGGIQPSEMQFIPLQELCKVVTKGTTPTTLGKSFTSTGINFIKAESILDNHSIDSSKFAFIDEETNALLKRSVIKANDIVFTIAGTLGRFAMVDNSVLPANTNQAVAIIRPDETKVTPAYLYSFFIGNWHNEYYSKRIQQAVQANLSLTTIKSLPIAVLKNTTMNNYEKLVSPLFALMKNNEEENRRLSKLRDTLLPRLMSGELDVSNLDL
ncbi:restriction endonuclease subunit S [Lactobacillus iners]|jgi:putative uncharacterized protein (fragment)|nr:restriction endonuclease subunit S [Lactobacillus iners]MCT7739472.1 restriction endonuclease subunit S [Lactobacillus iners]